MTQALSDLSVLAGRPADREPAGEDPEAPRSGAGVPVPKARWKTRVLLPGAILCITAATLLMTAWRALWPATPVRVAPVVLKTGVQPAGKVIVQAPGWVEADPFPTAVTALADGVVAEVLVLEGQRVEPNQVVARLIADEARLALAKAESALHAAAADVAAAQAELKAAQREWDNPIELTR
ncbi:MAG TPA: hemolysin D, partial [Phycisphaerae bacterium]|nr:hemolysin D [Phycisphaerae bacterium]